MRPDGSIDLAGGGRVLADGTHLHPDGTKVAPDPKARKTERDRLLAATHLIDAGRPAAAVKALELPGGIVAVGDAPAGKVPVKRFLADGRVELAGGAKLPLRASGGKPVQGLSADGAFLERVVGIWIRGDIDPDTRVETVQFKTANREFAAQRQDFRWFRLGSIRDVACPSDVFVLERVENGDFYGFLTRIDAPDDRGDPSAPPAARLAWALAAVRARESNEVEPLAAGLSVLSNQLQHLRESALRLQYLRRKALEGGEDPAGPIVQSLDRQLAGLDRQRKEIDAESGRISAEQKRLILEIAKNTAVFTDAGGTERTIPLANVVRAYQPNSMGPFAKTGHYITKIGELLWENPRESNTEGGLFPSIFGTVMLVFLMSITCFPLGVLAGIYLGEYAREGVLVRLVRIGVNNLAGIPSIVYGIFGLGFFVYQVGSTIDTVFYPEMAGVEPVFGTGGILWASLTLGLLTVPVVIVSTEEALRTIPRGVREGSYALGATKFQTLLRLLLPMASPGIMTGFILAMARAAGEVAPLMITGVVKLAPDLPVGGDFPFVHLDRKFMHLGFHIYDIGFQSPNVEASKPMVYVTTLLLLLIVLVMSSTAIYLRNRMRKRYQIKSM